MANSKKIHIRTVTFERILIAYDAAAAVESFYNNYISVMELLTTDHTSVDAGIAESGLIHMAEMDEDRMNKNK